MCLLRFLVEDIKNAPVERAKNFEITAGNYADSGHTGKSIILYCKAAEIYFYRKHNSDFNRLIGLLRELSKSLDPRGKELLNYQMIKTGKTHFESGKRFDRKDKVEAAVEEYRLAREFWPDNEEIQNNLRKIYDLKN